ncbi:MAG: tripartite tricarboxylate transporter substrate binding protein [Hyphomicrobiales bacterium]
MRGAAKAGRSGFCCLILGLAAASLHADVSLADTWPSKPLRAVVPFSAGSATDIIARAVFDQVSTQIGQPVVIENRGGAGGTIGAAAVAKAEPDGYTILVHSSSHTVSAVTYTNLTYDTAKDLPPIIPLGNLPNVLIAASSKGYKSVKDLVAAAKANPGKMNYASAGPGSAAHLNAERFKLSAKFDAVHVPFKGAPEAMREIVAGRVDFYFCPILPALPLIKESQLSALAVSGSKRASALPDVPTTTEAGYANSEYNFWIGVFATGGTPPAIMRRLHDEVAKALQNPVVKERLARLGAEPMPMTTDQFRAYVKKEIESSAALVKAAGIQVN